MFYIITLIVIVLVSLYLFPSDTKGALKWHFTGVRGLGQDMKAIRTNSLKRQILDPDRVNTVVNILNKEFVDTTKYHKEATARNLAAEKSYHEKLQSVLADID